MVLVVRIPVRDLEFSEAVVDLNLVARHARERLGRLAGAAHRACVDGGQPGVREADGDGLCLPPSEGREGRVGAVRAVVGARLSVAHEVEAYGVSRG